MNTLNSVLTDFKLAKRCGRFSFRLRPRFLGSESEMPVAKARVAVVGSVLIGHFVLPGCTVVLLIAGWLSSFSSSSEMVIVPRVIRPNTSIALIWKSMSLDEGKFLSGVGISVSFITFGSVIWCDGELVVGVLFGLGEVDCGLLIGPGLDSTFPDSVNNFCVIFGSTGGGASVEAEKIISRRKRGSELTSFDSEGDWVGEEGGGVSR